MTPKFRIHIAIFGLIGLGWATASQAAIYSYGFTDDGSATSSAFTSSFVMTVEEYGTEVIGSQTHNRVLFSFYNNYSEPDSTITTFGFCDGTILSGPFPLATTGVLLVADNPANDNTQPFVNVLSSPVTAYFRASDVGGDSNANGVNPGEVGQMYFTLQAGLSLGDVLSALDGTGGHLEVAIKIQSLTTDFGNGDSEKLVVTGPGTPVPVPTPVPEPASVLAWGLGLAIAGLGARRRRKG